MTWCHLSPRALTLTGVVRTRWYSICTEDAQYLVLSMLTVVVLAMGFIGPLEHQGTQQVLNFYIALLGSPEKRYRRNWLRTCRSVQVSVKFWTGRFF